MEYDDIEPNSSILYGRSVGGEGGGGRAGWGAGGWVLSLAFPLKLLEVAGVGNCWTSG